MFNHNRYRNYKSPDSSPVTIESEPSLIESSSTKFDVSKLEAKKLEIIMLKAEIKDLKNAITDKDIHISQLSIENKDLSQLIIELKSRNTTTTKSLNNDGKDLRISELELQVEKLSMSVVQLKLTIDESKIEKEELYKIILRSQLEHKSENSERGYLYEYQQLDRQFKDLEEYQNLIIQENNELKAKMDQSMTSKPNEVLVYFSIDIEKIRQITGEIHSVLVSIKNRKCVAKTLFLRKSTETESKNPAYVVTEDIQIIKDRLKQIKKLVSQLYENYSEEELLI